MSDIIQWKYLALLIQLLHHFKQEGRYIPRFCYIWLQPAEPLISRRKSIVVEVVYG